MPDIPDLKKYEAEEIDALHQKIMKDPKKLSVLRASRVIADLNRQNNHYIMGIILCFAMLVVALVYGVYSDAVPMSIGISLMCGGYFIFSMLRVHRNMNAMIIIHGWIELQSYKANNGDT